MLFFQIMNWMVMKTVEGSAELLVAPVDSSRRCRACYRFPSSKLGNDFAGKAVCDGLMSVGVAGHKSRESVPCNE